MSPILFGIVAGALFGLLAMAVMLPLSFADKRQALLAAFASRFSIGFLIPNLDLPLSGWATGAVVGLMVSFSDAIVTKAYAPILIMGTVGGAIIGILSTAYL